MKNVDKITLENFPLEDYAENRAKYGHMEFLRQDSCQEIAPGVKYEECVYRRGDGVEVWVYLVHLPKSAPVQLAVAAAALHTAKPVKCHAEDFEKFFNIPVLFAMNAGFFHFFIRGGTDNGDLTPYGIQVVRGVEMARPGIVKDKVWYGYNFLAVDKTGRAFISNAPEYEAKLRGTLEYAVGGGMRLIREGKVFLYTDPLGKSEVKAPRTAVGFDADGNAILMCCDGRSKRSGGMSLADEIDLYMQLGNITELLNLDGGGSTTVVVKNRDGEHQIRNIPSGPAFPFSAERYGYEKTEPVGGEQARGVSDAVLIIPKQYPTT